MCTFNFYPFATLVKNFKLLPSASPKLLNLNQGHPSKNGLSSHFADIIKIVTMFIKAIIKDSRKVKRTGNYVSKSNLYLCHEH